MDNGKLVSKVVRTLMVCILLLGLAIVALFLVNKFFKKTTPQAPIISAEVNGICRDNDPDTFATLTVTGYNGVDLNEISNLEALDNVGLNYTPWETIDGKNAITTEISWESALPDDYTFKLECDDASTTFQITVISYTEGNIITYDTINEENDKYLIPVDTDIYINQTDKYKFGNKLFNTKLYSMDHNNITDFILQVDPGVENGFGFLVNPDMNFSIACKKTDKGDKSFFNVNSEYRDYNAFIVVGDLIPNDGIYKKTMRISPSLRTNLTAHGTNNISQIIMFQLGSTGTIINKSTIKVIASVNSCTYYGAIYILDKCEGKIDLQSYQVGDQRISTAYGLWINNCSTSNCQINIEGYYAFVTEKITCGAYFGVVGEDVLICIKDASFSFRPKNYSYFVQIDELSGQLTIKKCSLTAITTEDSGGSTESYGIYFNKSSSTGTINFIECSKFAYYTQDNDLSHLTSYSIFCEGNTQADFGASINMTDAWFFSPNADSTNMFLLMSSTQASNTTYKWNYVTIDENTSTSPDDQLSVATYFYDYNNPNRCVFINTIAADGNDGKSKIDFNTNLRTIFGVIYEKISWLSPALDWIRYFATSTFG